MRFCMADSRSMPPMRGMCRSVRIRSKLLGPPRLQSSSSANWPSWQVTTLLCPRRFRTRRQTFMLMVLSSATSRRSSRVGGAAAPAAAPLPVGPTGFCPPPLANGALQEDVRAPQRYVTGGVAPRLFSAGEQAPFPCAGANPRPVLLATLLLWRGPGEHHQAQAVQQRVRSLGHRLQDELVRAIADEEVQGGEHPGRPPPPSSRPNQDQSLLGGGCSVHQQPPPPQRHGEDLPHLSVPLDQQDALSLEVGRSLRECPMEGRHLHLPAPPTRRPCLALRVTPRPLHPPAAVTPPIAARPGGRRGRLRPYSAARSVRERPGRLGGRQQWGHSPGP